MATSFSLYPTKGTAPNTPRVPPLPHTPRNQPGTPGTPRTPGGTGVSADVAFVGNRFPNYRLSNHGDSEEDEDHQLASKKDVISKELSDLLLQQKKLSVRDLAHKFESGMNAAQAAAAAITENVKVRDTVVQGDALLSRVHDKLEDIRGRASGRNLEDIEEAMAAVEALGGHWALREGEFAQEKAEVRKMAVLFKQASDDSKKMVEEARAIANEEIEIARNAARRVSELLDEQDFKENERGLGSREKEEYESLKREVLEARRIKMLHGPTKVMDMEFEIEGLKKQLKAKSDELQRIRKEIEVRNMRLNGKMPIFKLEGLESLGGTLYVSAQASDVPPPSVCTIQWYRVRPDGSQKEQIAGAVRAQYAPEPSDVGRFLQASIFHPEALEQIEWVQTTAPIDPASGLELYVEALAKKGGAEFNVVIIQQNDEDVEKRSAHVLDVGKDRIKLRKGRRVLAREHYTQVMQLCGARGGGEAAAQGLFWMAKKGLSYMLALESERERNAAIMLARRFAIDQNIVLCGPDDRVGHAQGSI